ncbi:MAG: hypothetical protein AAB690_02645 [Patescibacteria group bacterium]
MLRPLSTLVVLFAIVFLPYWIYAPLLFLALLYFSFYGEGIALGFVIDLLYGSSAPQGLFSFPFAIGALLIFFISLAVRDRFRIHA